MSDEINLILETACRAGITAAKICRAVLAETPESLEKGDKSPVTLADYGCQAAILREISATFPDHGIIAEEGSEHLRKSAGDAGAEKIVNLVSDATGETVNFDQVCAWIDHQGSPTPDDDGAVWTWAIDPIDGTKGFLRRDQYAVAIGLMKDGVPFAGVLVCPNLPVDLENPDGQRGVLFCAAEGCGATAVPVDGGETRAIKSSGLSNPGEWRVLGSVESAHGDPSLVVSMMESAGVGGGFVRYDSQVKYGIVASGEAEIYVRPRSRPDYRENIWDHAAGTIVAQEAGAIVTDLDGCPLDFTLGSKLTENRGVLVTAAPAVHQQVLDGLRVAKEASAD
ncbi:MAG TPA: inositol monophosphatase family protein [Planctomycetota bacterium]|jgi:3'(2'), 5'-bisphosphate nucleotidase|nr:3'(2'),5'-bisphosphate nucleotidase [Planctomycetota bacterium]MDP6129523.1 inositol monophosphatase family protein [Planctomycetota bacterium]MDP7245256.1 inositol monophosphatase family protein [Planctomycetota bacterium]HJM40389.1 inositol monophosphatase family protein [Planctomycetota bacterium]|tara:strand:- start:14172 stop:15185 length:1014 start_codon:yes stop_codon:yes gene_type:complete